MKTLEGPQKHVLDGVQIHQREPWKILGVVRAIQKHWQSSLQQLLQRRCNRDHSIANNIVQQKGSFSMPRKRK